MDTEPTTDVEPLQVAEDTVVTDAFVEWNLRYSNTPELVAILDEPIDTSAFEPATGDEDESYWIEENDHGIFYGWQDSLPVSEETGMATTTVEHAEYGTVEDRYGMFDHVVKSKQNDIEPQSALTVRFKRSKKGSPTSFAVRVDFARELLDRYINGPLGTYETAYWYWMRSGSDGYSWRNAPTDKEDYEQHNHAYVVLVTDTIATWRPKRTQDLDESDDMYVKN